MQTSSNALFAAFQQTTPMPLQGHFRCDAGQIVGLVGPSGAGKTSMLRALAGLMKPESGKVAVGNSIWFDSDSGIYLSANQRRVGLVFQDYALMPHLTALQNVELALLNQEPKQRRLLASQWLSKTRIAQSHWNRRPSELSGGQQQRVAIARAMARSPELLLLDEPFSAVDMNTRQALYELLADIKHELNIPIVLVTHDLREASLLCDQLVVLDGGVVLQQASPQRVHQAPRNGRVADLLGIQNHFKGVWCGSEGHGHATLEWLWPEAAGALRISVRDKGLIPAGHPVDWIIHNHGLTLVKQDDATSSDHAVNVLACRSLGEIVLVDLQLSAAESVKFRLTLTQAGAQGVEAGNACFLRLNTDLIHVMPIRERSEGRAQKNL